MKYITINELNSFGSHVYLTEPAEDGGYCSSSLHKNEVHFSLSRGQPTALILLDLSAALDIIDHSTLFSCLQAWF